MVKIVNCCARCLVSENMAHSKKLRKEISNSAKRFIAIIPSVKSYLGERSERKERWNILAPSGVACKSKDMKPAGLY